MTDETPVEKKKRGRPRKPISYKELERRVQREQNREFFQKKTVELEFEELSKDSQESLTKRIKKLESDSDHEWEIIRIYTTQMGALSHGSLNVDLRMTGTKLKLKFRRQGKYWRLS